MKEIITDYIVDFVSKYENSKSIVTKYRKPLVRFASVNHPDIYKLKEATFDKHLMPNDVLENPTIIIAYFVPFTEEIAKTNVEGALASNEWVVAYQETNSMFPKLNNYIIGKIEDIGYRAAVCEEATKFDKSILKSRWSHRHIAKIAGLGTFGINNMIITEEGCCGRYYTIVTNLPVDADEPLKEEYCLYKKDKSCGVCVKNCFSGALSITDFNRFRCYEVCRGNFEKYENEYRNKPQKIGNPMGGSDVCGKCVVNLPCSFKIPL